MRALEDLSIEVREGEIFGFLGPERRRQDDDDPAAARLPPPDARAGHRSSGLDVVRDSVAIRPRVGYLPGGIAFCDTLTGERLLDYLGRAVRPAADPPGRAARPARAVARGRSERPVRDYSRGMRQKIGIIQALQHDPELAILDEPTEGLDPLMQRAFYEILDDLRRAGRTIFFSSHVLSEVERVCDRVAIVRRGRLVALEDVADAAGAPQAQRRDAARRTAAGARRRRRRVRRRGQPTAG